MHYDFVVCLCVFRLNMVHKLRKKLTTFHLNHINALLPDLHVHADVPYQKFEQQSQAIVVPATIIDHKRLALFPFHSSF